MYMHTHLRLITNSQKHFSPRGFWKPHLQPTVSQSKDKTTFTHQPGRAILHQNAPVMSLLWDIQPGRDTVFPLDQTWTSWLLACVMIQGRCDVTPLTAVW